MTQVPVRSAFGMTGSIYGVDNRREVVPPVSVSIPLSVRSDSERSLLDLTSQEELTSKSDVFAYLLELYQNRLWYELTVEILCLVRTPPEEVPKEVLLDIYERVVRANLECHMAPLIHAEISYSLMTYFATVDQCKQFVEHVRSRVESDPAAVALMTIGLAALELVSNNIVKTESILKKVRIQYIEPYLGCAASGFVSHSDRAKRAFNVVLAALVSSELVDVGEIRSNLLIVKALAGSRNTWILDLVKAVSSGDFTTFEKLTPYWSQQPDIAKAVDIVREKISLVALCELVGYHGERSSDGSRIVAFDDIKKATRTNDVEQLLIKALSGDLIAGRMDEADRFLIVKHVRPRTVVPKHLRVMTKKASFKCKGVDFMRDNFKEHAKDLNR
ncbi:hypothetical protein ACOME3_009328 [Neoechinorhynchus agilis]